MFQEGTIEAQKKKNKNKKTKRKKEKKKLSYVLGGNLESLKNKKTHPEKFSYIFRKKIFPTF